MNTNSESSENKTEIIKGKADGRGQEGIRDSGEDIVTL